MMCEKITRIVHCKRESYDIYIGRPSKWGNPFTHRSSRTCAEIQVVDRNEAIVAYRQWIRGYRQVPGREPPSLEEIKSLQGKILGCWCKPLPCHGDVLAELADQLK